MLLVTEAWCTCISIHYKLNVELFSSVWLVYVLACRCHNKSFIWRLKHDETVLLAFSKWQQPLKTFLYIVMLGHNYSSNVIETIFQLNFALASQWHFFYFQLPAFGRSEPSQTFALRISICFPPSTSKAIKKPTPSVYWSTN